MKFTHLETGKKYQTGGKKIKSDTSYYTAPSGNRAMKITDTFEKDGNDKLPSKLTPKISTKPTTTIKKSPTKKPSTYEKSRDIEVPYERMSIEPRGPVLTPIKPTLVTAKLVKTDKPKPPTMRTPPSKPFNKTAGQKYRNEYQVPTGNAGNKPTMAAHDRKKGGGKNKLKIGI